MRGVLKQVRAFVASFVFTRLRLLGDIHGCRQGAGTLVASDLRNADRRHSGAPWIWLVPRYPDHGHDQG